MIKINEALFEFGAYGAALEDLGVNTNELITREEILALRAAVEKEANTKEEAEAYRDLYIAKFREAVAAVIKDEQ